MIASNTIQFPNRAASKNIEPTQRITLSETNNLWQEIIIKRLEELIRLEHGWDGYQGTAVSLENVLFALNMLEKICKWNTEAPQIVPGYSGDLQVEWHTLNGDLELHVKGPNKVNAWYWSIKDESQGEELQLKNDFSKVAEWVKAITESPLGINAAAA
jgi:hypothetical protein